MADPSHTESMAQIHSSEREIDALQNKITNADDSTTGPDDYAAMRHAQEKHRQQILKSKADMDQNKWSG
jgi:hypothetical protein